MEVEAWLNDLGLGQYAEAFGANDIDGETLPSLNGDNHKGLAVAPETAVYMAVFSRARLR